MSSRALGEKLMDRATHTSKPMDGMTEKIGRGEIKKIIDSYDQWYQNIRFGFMLRTRGPNYALWKSMLYECRFSASKALGKKTKNGVLIVSLPDLAGKRVIDIGCNAGLYSIEASCKGADYVLGVDVNSKAINQARDVAQIFRRLGRPVGNIEFRRVDDINNHLELLHDKDVLMACCVLYHLGPLHRFKEAIMNSTIQRLILQGNTRRLSRIGQTNNPSSEFYEPENKTWGNVVCDIKGMTRFCASINFKVERVCFPQHTHPVVIAERLTPAYNPY